MIRHLEVSRDIKAPVDVVWAAITDVTRMGEWSPECHTCAWNEGVDEPGLGARFTGHNRNGDKEWTTEAEIVEWVPGERFVFDGVFGDLRFSRWGYVLEPIDGGCRVTEVWDDLRPEEIIDITTSISGVADRPSHNQAGMEETLRRLAAGVEGAAAPPR